MRGLDEKAKPQTQTSSANDNYKEGVKNVNTIFLSVSDSFFKYELQEV